MDYIFRQQTGESLGCTGDPKGGDLPSEMGPWKFDHEIPDLADHPQQRLFMSDEDRGKALLARKKGKPYVWQPFRIQAANNNRT